MPGGGLSHISPTQRKVIYRLEDGYEVDFLCMNLVKGSKSIRVSPRVIQNMRAKGLLTDKNRLRRGYRRRR